MGNNGTKYWAGNCWFYQPATKELAAESIASLKMGDQVCRWAPTEREPGTRFYHIGYVVGFANDWKTGARVGVFVWWHFHGPGEHNEWPIYWESNPMPVYMRIGCRMHIHYQLTKAAADADFDSEFYENARADLARITA